MFFNSNRPVGRGVARATTVRTLFLLAILSWALAANLPIPLVAFEVITITLAAIAVLSALLVATLVLFNWPDVLVPQKSMRGQPGAIREWIHRTQRQ